MSDVLAQTMRLVTKMHETMGPEAMPRLLKGAPQTIDALLADAAGLNCFHGGLLMPPRITQIETDYGTIRIEADPRLRADTLILIHDERQLASS